MRSLLRKRFQLQLLFALIAAVSVAALAIELVINAVRHAESFVLSDTDRTLSHALQELDHEYRLRGSNDATWKGLPAGAQSLTLRAISQVVLASYPGVEGGFWASSQFVGYSYPLPTTEHRQRWTFRQRKGRLSKRSSRERSETARASESLRGKHDLVVISAIFDGPTGAWAMKRLPGQAESVQHIGSILLVALIGAALLGAAGVLATGIGLNRGIAQITRGLAALDTNFVPGLPVRHDELGKISAAINEMAQSSAASRRQRFGARTEPEQSAASWDG